MYFDKKLLVLTVVPLVLTLIVSPPKITVLDDQASIRLEIVSDGIIGSIEGLKTEVEFDQEQLEASFIKATLDVSTLSTGNMVRDIKLTSRKYLHKKKFPNITFKSVSIRNVYTGYLITGELTIKEITKEVVFDVGYSDGAVIGVGSVNLMDFDIELSNKRYENKLDIYIDLPLARPE
ncbi:YceI family protein [Flavobacteriaceae bacterium M23B6Z8]